VGTIGTAAFPTPLRSIAAVTTRPVSAAALMGRVLNRAGPLVGNGAGPSAAPAWKGSSPGMARTKSNPLQE
jgi:hypothetical protein